MASKTQICTSCLLPDTYPGIKFNNNGICNFCQEHQQQQLLGEKNFLKKISLKKGDKYDCLLGISGGKDSCYVAYLAKKKFGLRALAVCYDFPFITDLARKNIKNVCSSIDLDLLFVKSKDNLEYELIRNHLISLVPTGTTWGHCMFCHYGIEAVLYNIAKENNVPYILSGVTTSEVWWNPGNRLKFLINRIKKLPIREKIKFFIYQSKTFFKLVNQRRQFSIPGNSCLNVYRRPILPKDSPEIIKVFDYIKWDNDEIEKILKEETAWIKPDKAISWRYDCILEPLIDYTYLREFGISNVGLYLSALIRENIITRDDALKIQNNSENEKNLRNSVKKIYEFLNIPDSQLKKFFDA